MTAWYLSDPLPQDRLGKFCPGRRVFIQFETTPGDLPLLGVEADNLTGDGLEISIREVGSLVILSPCHCSLVNYHYIFCVQMLPGSNFSELGM